MRFPQIHLNGTSGATLLAEYQHAIFTLGSAISALEAVTVHGRDYYVQNTATGPDASVQAMNEHRARLNQLRGVLRELISIESSIQGQIEQRKTS
jgi:hypothetical protein